VNVKKILFGAITLIVGLVVLAGFFFQSQLGPTLTLLYQWGLVLVAVGGLVGMGYLAAMHIRNILQQKKGWVYSVVLLVSFAAALIAGFVLTPQNAFYQDLILNIQIPVETSLLAILAATLLFASVLIGMVLGGLVMGLRYLFSINHPGGER